MWCFLCVSFLLLADAATCEDSHLHLLQRSTQQHHARRLGTPYDEEVHYGRMFGLCHPKYKRCIQWGDTGLGYNGWMTVPAASWKEIGLQARWIIMDAGKEEEQGSGVVWLYSQGNAHGISILDNGTMDAFIGDRYPPTMWTMLDNNPGGRFTLHPKGGDLFALRSEGAARFLHMDPDGSFGGADQAIMEPGEGEIFELVPIWPRTSPNGAVEPEEWDLRPETIVSIMPDRAAEGQQLLGVAATGDSVELKLKGYLENPETEENYMSKAPQMMVYANAHKNDEAGRWEVIDAGHHLVAFYNVKHGRFLGIYADGVNVSEPALPTDPPGEENKFEIQWSVEPFHFHLRNPHANKYMCSTICDGITRPSQNNKHTRDYCMAPVPNQGNKIGGKGSIVAYRDYVRHQDRLSCQFKRHRTWGEVTRTTTTTTTTEGDPCDVNPVFQLKTPSYSNLGNHGPNEGVKGILYPEVGVIKGVPVDVKMTSLGMYEPFSSAQNGLAGSLGAVNMKVGSESTFQFALLKHGTDDPVEVDGMSISFLDLDEGKKGKQRSRVTVCDGADAVVTDPSDLEVQNDGLCTIVSSSKKGTGEDNPTSTTNLTDVQKKKIVTFNFGAGSKFRVTLGVALKGKAGRNFMFAFEPIVGC